MNKLQKLQNRAARIAISSPYDAPSQPFLGKLGWQTIRELIDMETATMEYRSINNEAPDYLSTLTLGLQNGNVANNLTYSKHVRQYELSSQSM